MSLFNLLLFTLVIIIIHTYAQWNVTTISTPPLPRGDFNKAVGWYHDTIYIFGGDQHSNAWLEYIISSNTMIDRGADQLPYTTNGHGNFYTQMNDKLYWIGSTAGKSINSIYSYDYRFKTFNEATIMITNGTAYSCLTAYNDLLFVVGGFYRHLGPIAFNNTHAFNISSSEWMQSIATLNWHRREPACTVDTHRGVVYTIAGGDPWRRSFETLVIGEDITQSTWILSENMLNYESWGIRAVYVEYTDSIILIGGTSNISSIDCKTGAISVVGILNYPILAPGVVLGDNILYIFSGYQSIETWQRVTNPLVFGGPTNWTYNPTSISDPSLMPSFYPSGHPIQTPSSNPSHPPTNNPSSGSPTEIPSRPPSGFPSVSPTETNDILIARNDVITSGPTQTVATGRVNEYISTNVYLEQTFESSMVRETSAAIWISVFGGGVIVLFAAAYFVWKKGANKLMVRKSIIIVGGQEIDIQPVADNVQNETHTNTDIGNTDSQPRVPKLSADIEELYDNEGARAGAETAETNGSNIKAIVDTKGTKATKGSTNDGNTKVGEGMQAKGEGVQRTAETSTGVQCCKDCGLVKMGSVYHCNGLFYCNDCAAYYYNY